MVDLLSQGGFLDGAQRLNKSMPMKPNDVVWDAFLGGCMIHRNSEIASRAARNLMAVPEENQIIDCLMPMSNVLAVAKR